jgi:methionyl aminopeptidase
MNSQIGIKSPQQIEAMQIGGRKLSKILRQLTKISTPGITLNQIEAKAQELIVQTGAKPGFMEVPGYRWATCLNVNHGTVHGVPDDYSLKDQDVLSIDIGILYKGLHTDTSTTFQVGSKTPQIQKFLEAGRAALNHALKQVKPGRHIGDISIALQTKIESSGYRCIPELTGHGIGENLHEYPPVPSVQRVPIQSTPILEKNMTLAVEVIYTMGDPDYYTDAQNNWTIYTKDGKISAVFEKTIAVAGGGCLFLTP